MAELVPFLRPLRRTVFRASLDGVPGPFTYDVAGFSGLAALNGDPYLGPPAVANVWQITTVGRDARPPESDLGVFIGVNDAPWSGWTCGAGTLEIARALGYGVPARFTYEITKHTHTVGDSFSDPVTDDDEAYSSGTFEFGATDLTTATVVIPATTHSSTTGPPPRYTTVSYQLSMTRVQIPWR